MNTIGSQNIYIKLNILENKVNDLDVKLDKILSLLEKNSEDCKKMSSHIDFVDNVYENVKNPLGFICNKVGKLSGEETYSLENNT